MIRTALAALIAIAGASAALAQDGVPEMQEIPTLANTHQGLPPVSERIPLQPLVVDLAAAGRTEGTYGGDLRTMIGRSKDIRLINVWGYARLVGFDKDFMLVPDILEDVEEEDGRVFTFYLREGHKWSDGHPFTAEDFRYYFEEIATNTELSPTPPPFLLSGDQLPDFEVLDETTVRYTFTEPNPRFLPTLAQATPPFIYRPAHYLKQFNPKYGDAGKIEEMVEEARVRSWAPLHNFKDEMYDATNPDEPSLQPWVPTRNATDRRFVMVRNPYFHRVTSEGHQLPFIDRVVMSVVDGSLIPTKVQAGDADLQARGLVFGDLPVLKRGAEKRDYSVRLWPQANSTDIALYPNLTVKDPVLRKLFRDRRFREALSLSVDRKLLNKVLFFGLGQPSANLILPESPLAGNFATAVLPFDVEKANALLDEIGLTERNGDGIRLMEDGRPLELIAETAGERSIEIDALELIKDNWRDVGIDLYPRPSQRDVMRNRAFSGDLALAVSAGYDNGMPTANMPPDERVPVSTMFFTGPAWGAYSMSGGESGEKPDYEPAIELTNLFDEWLNTATEEQRAEIWSKILKIHADEVLTIGTVQGVVQPVVVANRLQNVPEKGIYGWDPGAQFGLYHPDEFYFTDGR